MTVELYVGLTKYQGKEQDSVLIKPVSPGKPKADRTPLPANPEFDDHIPF